jgi:uncharacterized protein (DUF362 family)
MFTNNTVIINYLIKDNVKFISDEIIRGMKDMNLLFHSNNNVLIKPNLVNGAYFYGPGNTSKEVIEATIIALKYFGISKITIAESAGVESDTFAAFKNSGYQELSKKYGFKLISIDDSRFKTQRFSFNNKNYDFLISELINDFDVFINIPVLKTHLCCGVSASVKNCFGFINDIDKQLIHRLNLLEEVLSELPRIFKPDFIIVDGTRGQGGLGGGTDFTNPFESHLLVFGKNPVAVDSVVAEILNQPKKIRYLNWAEEKGYGISNLEKINKNIRGEPFIPTIVSPEDYIQEQFKNLEIDSSSACTGCRSCFLTTLTRFSSQKLKKNTIILSGDKLKNIDLSGKGTIILFGNCAIKNIPIKNGQNEQYLVLNGCPPSGKQFMDLIRKYNLFCNTCYYETKTILEEENNFFKELKDKIRVVARGEILIKGKNKLEDNKYLILIGDCMRRYYDTNIRRLEKFEINKVYFTLKKTNIFFIRGCPPEKKEILNIINAIKRREIG